MELELKQLLTSIDSRFSGPKSRRLYEMMTGKIDLDYDEIEAYLNSIKDFGGAQGDQFIQNNQKDAEAFLVQYTQYRQTMKR
jgi:hypothetical protein